MRKELLLEFSSISMKHQRRPGLVTICDPNQEMQGLYEEAEARGAPCVSAPGLDMQLEEIAA